MRKLDKIDLKIIQILQKNARTPLKEIAVQVFLSSPSVSARIEKLEQEGVITGYTAKVNPLYLNYHIKAFINLEVEPLQKPVFYPFIEAIPNVVECNCVTGDYSMLIETLLKVPHNWIILLMNCSSLDEQRRRLCFQPLWNREQFRLEWKKIKALCPSANHRKHVAVRSPEICSCKGH